MEKSSQKCHKLVEIEAFSNLKQKNLHVVLKTENKQRDCARTPHSRTSSSQLTANVAEIKTRKKNILICIFIL